MLRTLLAILAGFAVMSVVALGCDLLATRLAPGQFAPNGEVRSAGTLILILVYTLFACALGGYVTARVEIERPVRAAAILGGLIALFTIINMAATSGAAPLWWRILAGALCGPLTLAGGWAAANAANRGVRSR